MLHWEDINHDNGFYLRRTKVFGGWLISAISDVGAAQMGRNDCEWRTSITFVPDPNHEWKLNQ